MRIRNRKTYLTSLPEGTPPKNRTRSFTGTLYLLLLAAIAVYLVYFFLHKAMYIETRGQVEVARHLIHAPASGVIDKILTGPGAVINAGDSLAVLKQPYETPKEADPFLRERLKAKRDLAFNEARLMVATAKLAILKEISEGKAGAGKKEEAAAPPEKFIKIDSDIQKTLAKARYFENLLEQKEIERVRLEKAAFRGRLLELEKAPVPKSPLSGDEEKTKQEMILAREEIKALRNYRKNLASSEMSELELEMASLRAENDELQAYISSLPESPIPRDGALQVQAPAAGTVMALFKSAGEDVKAGDAILAIRENNAAALVHGFFMEKDLPHLQPGTEVDITLPDGYSTVGKIVNTYAIASTYREKLRDHYVPITSEVLAEIVSLNQGDEERWRQFERMDVRILVKR